VAFGWKALKRVKRSGDERYRVAEVTEANMGYRRKHGLYKANMNLESKHGFRNQARVTEANMKVYLAKMVANIIRR
jgi:hypothetical protein